MGEVVNSVLVLNLIATLKRIESTYSNEIKDNLVMNFLVLEPGKKQIPLGLLQLYQEACSYCLKFLADDGLTLDPILDTYIREYTKNKWSVVSFQHSGKLPEDNENTPALHGFHYIACDDFYFLIYRDNTGRDIVCD